MKTNPSLIKGKRFLLTHWTLGVLGGSENNILQMAEYIRDNGGVVEFFTYALHDPMKTVIKNKKLSVKVDDIDLFDQTLKTKVKYNLEQIDYVVVCQNVIPVDVIKQLNGKNIKTKFIFFHMSSHVGIAMEAPLFYELESKIASKILTISEEAKEMQLERLLGVNIKNLVYYRNPVPDYFIENSKIFLSPKTPQKIAVISNHPPREIIELADEIKLVDNNIEVSYIGRWSNNSQLVTPDLLSKYDVVISIGKTVQYCLVIGVPIYVYDRFGGQGYINDYNAAKRLNFSGRDAGTKTVKTIANELVGNYQKAVNYQNKNTSFFRKEFLLSNAIGPVFNGKSSLMNNNFSQQYINYLISMQLLLKEKYLNMVYAHGIEKDISEKSLQLLHSNQVLVECKNELNSFLSVKRSIRLLAGNIKRRIIHAKNG